MLSLSSLWRYYTFPKEAVESCQDDILRHNAQSLKIISLVTGILVGLFSVFPLLVEKQPGKFTVYIVIGVVELLVYVFAGHLCKHKIYTPIRVNLGFLVFFITLMTLGMYIGVFTQPEQHAVNFMVFLVCSQVIFVLRPLYTVLLNLITVTVFSFFAITMKSETLWRFDVSNAAAAAVIGIAFSWYLSHVVIKEMLASRRLEIERNYFRDESMKDELTGLSNRREYLNVANYYISISRHVHQTVCAIMLDVDFFKNYNDFYGHQQGDEVLKALGKVLHQLAAEENVFAARVGGEEFLVLWTENRIDEAKRVAVKLRQMILDLNIPHEKSAAAPCVTASLGLYVLRGGSPGTADDLYREADAALYEAKARGRNCIILRDSAENRSEYLR
jgi:diguanylate cyclase (GGDEF)-like protein